MKLGPYELDQIYTGDARILAQEIPDESVDLIFTDPVYQNIDDYRWLAETAARILKPNGACLAFSNAKWVSIILKEVPTNNPLLSYQRASAICPLNGHVIAKTHYLIWWGSESIPGYIPDGYLSVNWSANGEDPGGHRWTKNPKYMKKVLMGFTLDGAIVFDPFTGGGTVPAVCKMLGRHYLAFEINPDTAERARQRVQNTQPPLLIPQPEQLEIEAMA